MPGVLNRETNRSRHLESAESYDGSHSRIESRVASASFRKSPKVELSDIRVSKHVVGDHGGVCRVCTLGESRHCK